MRTILIPLLILFPVACSSMARRAPADASRNSEPSPPLTREEVDNEIVQLLMNRSDVKACSMSSTGRQGSELVIAHAWSSMRDSDLLTAIQTFQPDVILVGENHGVENPRTWSDFPKSIQQVLPDLTTLFFEAPPQAEHYVLSLPPGISVHDLLNENWPGGGLSQMQKAWVVQMGFRRRAWTKLGFSMVPVDSEWVFYPGEMIPNLDYYVDLAKKQYKWSPQETYLELGKNITMMAAMPGVEERNCTMARNIAKELTNGKRGLFVVGNGHIDPKEDPLHTNMLFIQRYLIKAGFKVMVLPL
jgi:hypothetical protein